MSTRERHESLREEVTKWNRLYPVGTAVHCRIYQDRMLRTSSPATLLFQRKPVIYLEGLNGYFNLSDVRPLSEAPALEESGIAILFPGQGAQRRGMGRDLFAAFPEQTRLASDLLGYSIELLCLEDREGLLDQTAYTQAAIYVVNALGYWHRLRTGVKCKPAFLMGHSVGEFNALLVADVFDFETGLKLVAKRGELMGMVRGGAMAAVLGARPECIRNILNSGGLDDVDLANYNTPSQTVISGTASAIDRALKVLAVQNIEAVPLRVSGAFHSHHMREAQIGFTEYAEKFRFAAPSTPVIANATGRPYEADRIVETLGGQITSPVRWIDSVRYVLSKGNIAFVEIGSAFLRSMVNEISSTLTPDQPMAHNSLSSNVGDLPRREA